MFIDKEQLSNIKVPYGRVLVELNVVQVEKTTSGIAIVSYADETKSSLLSRWGKVYAVNSNTKYPEKNYSFEGECEVEVGDVVWWDKTSIFEAFKNEVADMRVVYCEDKTYVVIPYNDLVLRERNGEYLGLNDKVIMRPIQKEVSSFLDLSMTSMSKPRRDILEVVHVPSFKGRYKNIQVGNRVVEVYERPVPCRVGDRVHLMNGGSKIVFLEDEINLTLEKHLVYCKSSQIAKVL